MLRKSSEIYLDSNATTPVLPAAAQAAKAAMEEIYGNPSSTHVAGLKARHMLESARQLVREVMGASRGQIVFTSGATEAIQMGVFSTLCRLKQQPQDEQHQSRLLLYAATEHKAVPQAIRHWNRLLGTNRQVVEIPVDQEGQLDLDFLRQHAAQADLICTMAVNNETGVTLPIKSIEAVIRGQNPEVAWLVDCVQAIGKLNLELAETTIDYAPVSGHKIYAPKGIGLLYVRDQAPLIPLLAGGGQEHGARAGTENLPGVAAIAAVMEQLAASPTRTFADPDLLHDRQQRLVQALESAFPGVVFNTPFEQAVSTTINFAVPGLPNNELLNLFDAAGIRVSSGSACSSSVQGSYVLDAMGLPKWRSDGAIRLSFGPLTEDSEIDAACDRILDAGRALCDACWVPSEKSADDSNERLDGLIQLKQEGRCTWLLMDADSKQCVVIDPAEALINRTEALIRCQESNVLAVLDSHQHTDRESSRQPCLDALGAFAANASQSDDPLGWPQSDSQPTVTLADGSLAPCFLLADKRCLAQIELPGHTRTSRAFLVGCPTSNGTLPAENIEFAFTGDTILMGGLGRTDFHCSDIRAMYDSLRRLAKIIAPETVICPTHDYHDELATTLAYERSHNAFLDAVLSEPPIGLEEFLARKPELDAQLQQQAESAWMCGFLRTSGDADPAPLEVEYGELKAFFETHRDSWLIDVREPHEFSFAQDWDEFGLQGPPQNIPLTRISGFLPQLLRANREYPRDVIFICRSGTRSELAAAVARRAGIESARHVAGGIALNAATRCVADEAPNYMI